MTTETLTIVPLGGLGEVGMNAMTLEVAGARILLDCGVTFPGRHLGVDLQHPRFDHVLGSADALLAILITHGHEDHIGALPYLLRAIRPLREGRPVPVYGPPYALELIRRRLDEHRMALPPMHATTIGERFEVGPFDVEPYRVNHSIPDSTGLILRTPAGTIVHSGDFKIEARPVDEEPFGEEALRRAAAEGVDLVMSDSTNVDVEGTTGEEMDVQPVLRALIAEAPGRIVVAQFASNVWRMRAVFEAARAANRKVCLLGRSVRNHYEVARGLGFLDGVEDLVVDGDAARKLPRREVCAIATGTQGEWPAALGRLSRDDHADMQIDEGDTVVFSSRVIPGQEKSVFELQDALERKGIVVVHRRSHAGVHVSGHAAREEQKRLLGMCQPRAFLPVHGTFHHLRRHAELGRECGVPSTVALNGAVLELHDGVLRQVGEVTAGRVSIQRSEEVDQHQLDDRGLLSWLGHVVIAFARTGKRFVVDAQSRGALRAEIEDDVLDELVDWVRKDLGRAGTRDLDELEDVARRSARRYFHKRFRRKPLVTAIGLDAD